MEEMETFKKIYNEKIEKLEKDLQMKKQEILETEIETFKKIYNEKIEKLEKDLQMKKQEKKPEILETEMETFKKIYNEKIEKLEKDLQMKEQEKKQEILETEMETFKKIYNEKIEKLEKDLQMKEQEKKQEILETEMETFKKIYNEKIEKLEKDLQMKEQEKKQEILETEMETFKKIYNEKIEKLEKDLQMKKQEILETEMETFKKIYNEKIEKLEKDLQMKEQEKKQEILNTKVKKQIIKETKKIHNEKIEKLENDCVQKDLKIKEQENIQEILKTENALLHLLRAEANADSGNPLDTDIILDCCQAIEKGLQGCRAYMLRGKHLLKLGLFDAAMNDFETAITVKESEECLKSIEDAKALMKKWESQSLYEVLGVGQTATRAEILKAFKGLYMKFHPDRHGDKPKFIQEAFEEKFKELVDAITVLTDDQIRKVYDAEVQPPRSRQQPGQRDQHPRRQKGTVFDDMFDALGKFFVCK
ncbi:chromosome partition protein Smc-like [Palaemon carinicauda]|uniref:chromosome partition protein Smc-like n=1 Tax=Palaemon carinicauda TaxID=392227 RepID=UPI0035B69357